MFCPAAEHVLACIVFPALESALIHDPVEMRAKAVECEAKTCMIQDAGVIRMYTELARQWRELADQIDHNKR
jgi:hypothetical protein